MSDSKIQIMAFTDRTKIKTKIKISLYKKIRDRNDANIPASFLHMPVYIKY